jgi:hypothetical protein
LNKSPWLLILLLLQGCATETYVLKTNAGNFCIPAPYVVEIDTSGIPSDQYDTEGGGYGISLIIKPEELASAVNGYEKIALRPGIPGFQPMYIMLSESVGLEKVASIPPSSESLEATPRLMRLEQDQIAWEVAEKINGDFFQWGNCTNTFDADNSYDCIRDFETGGLRMSYQVHQLNLKVYPAIDAFLAGKVKAWKCQSSQS